MSRDRHPSPTGGAVVTGRLTGIVVRWDRAYGFIDVPERGSWYFAHKADLVDVLQLQPGQRVSFIPTTTPRGPRAVCVEVLEPEQMS
jgi:cold shock CspA family protein